MLNRGVLNIELVFGIKVSLIKNAVKSLNQMPQFGMNNFNIHLRKKLTFVMVSVDSGCES